ncbi:MAG: hypothetical protein KDA16_12020 [Phycisphaerales bacterium]|nr:hypothetical protein [Phycisphaerales bacterium]
MQHGEYDGYRGDGYEVEGGGAETEGWRGHAPPTVAGDVIQARPSSAWPTVFGVIGIILSGWGLITSGCGMLFLAGIGGALGLGGGGRFSQQMQASGVSGMSLVAGGVQYVVTMALAVYLLIAAFGVTTVLGFVTTNYNQLNQQMGGQSQAFMIGVIVGGIAVSAIFALWFPVLNLIWFRRAVIRDEVSQWM